jgi:hypothetical protein
MNGLTLTVVPGYASKLSDLSSAPRRESPKSTGGDEFSGDLREIHGGNLIRYVPNTLIRLCVRSSTVVILHGTEIWPYSSRDSLELAGLPAPRSLRDLELGFFSSLSRSTLSQGLVRLIPPGLWQGLLGSKLRDLFAVESAFHFCGVEQHRGHVGELVQVQDAAAVLPHIQRPRM